jgi:hypothetical protein
MKILGNRYGLMKVYTRSSDAADGAISMAETAGSREYVREKRDKLIKTLDYIPDVIENHIRELTGGKDV